MTVQTLPYQTLIIIDRASFVPVYQQISNGLTNLIHDGILQPGFRLPSSRQLSEILQIHRTTAVAAYEELKGQGWIESVQRRGIFVCSHLPLLSPRAFWEQSDGAAASEGVPDYFLQLTQKRPQAPTTAKYRLIVNDGFPDARIAPLTQLLTQYRYFLKKTYMQGLFMHGEAAGSVNLRSELAAFLGKTRGLNVTKENIMITRGGQMSIYIAAQMVLKPGSTVIVGEPNYNMANKVFEHLGAALIKINVDDNGIDVDAIERQCKAKKPDLIYIIPHHHHPTTVTLSGERRMKLLNLIRTYRIPVIEDDYDYDFHYNNAPILPLASADHQGLVLYIGSITKAMAPSIRVGYMVAGSEFIWQASQLRQMMEIRGDVLMEESLALLYKNGDMQKHISKSVKLYRMRRDTLCSLLEKELPQMLSFKKPAGGMSVWTVFDPRYPVGMVSKKMADMGICMNDGSLYNVDADYNALRIGFASMTPEEMLDLVTTLKRVVTA